MDPSRRFTARGRKDRGTESRQFNYLLGDTCNWI
jgi:hypothetical protein